MKPAVLTALITAALSIGASVFTFGERLGRAEAEASYWYRYAEGLMKRPECR